MADRFSPPSRIARGLSIFLMAICFGALAWVIPGKASGHFEPYDSGIGLLVNQAILVAATIWAALRHGLRGVLIFLAGAYVGLNGYPYLFGSSESRAWAALGAVVNVLLLVVPALCALALLAYRRVRHRRQFSPDGSG